MMIVLFAATLLGFGTLALIALPLVRPPTGETSPIGTVSAELLARRDRIYGELRELEFDLRVGKVTDPDYSEARDRLESEAARVLRAIDVEVLALDAAIEREIGQVRSVGTECVACGASVTPGARYCPSCGATIKVATYL
jgi:rRNA maturation endonuclease Nob1